MRKLRLAIALPVLQCGLAGVLRYWARHALAPVPIGLESIRVPAWNEIRFGLNPLATFAAMLVDSLVDRFSNPLSQYGTSSGSGFELVFLAFVACTWYLIGRWLDQRASGTDRPRARSLTVPSILLRLLFLGGGLSLLLLSLHSYTYGLPSEIAARAMLQLWALFLISVPGVSFVRWVRALIQRQYSRADVESDSKPLSNFAWFLITIGMFAALFAIGLLITLHAKRP